MATNSNQNTPNQNEIDLYALFLKLGELMKKAFIGLFKLIGDILVFLLRKWYYFATALILTVLSSYILNKATEYFYQSDMLIRANATSNQTIMASLNKLGEYASDQNYSALSNELDLSTEDVRKILNLESFWLYDIGDDGIYDGIDFEQIYLSDTGVVKLENEFVIRITVSDPDIVKPLEHGLLSYLEANPYLIALNKQRLMELEAQLNQTNYEIEKLDSLQKREYYTNPDHLRQQESQIVFTSEKTIQTYHNDMLRLLRLRQTFERDLNIHSGVVTIIEGFSIPNIPENRSIHYGRKFIWYYLGLALVISILVTYRRKIWIRKESD
jgi:hypothetical protein